MNQPSVATAKRLFAMSGNRCAFPKCSNPLVDGTKVTGEICHIRGRRPESPRYDAAQSDRDRHSFENLLLLCPLHHVVVDADSEAYTVDRLLKMKRNHEASVQAVLEPLDAVANQLIANTTVSGSPQNLGISFNQSGGITAGTVNVHAAPEPTLEGRLLFANKPVGDKFHTRVELRVKSPYPPGNLSIGVKAPSVRRIELLPQRAGIVSIGPSGTRPGFAFTNLQQPFGTLLLDVFTANPEKLDVEWDFQ